METKVRVINTQNRNEHYAHYYIEILQPRYPDDKKYLETIGNISFQSNKENGHYSEWYAMTFHCDTSNPKYLFEMAKLAKFIKDNNDCKVQPHDVLKLINATLYFWHEGDFIPESSRGLTFYRVYAGNDYYTSFISESEQAQKTFEKLKRKHKWDGRFTFHFDHLVPEK